MNVDDCIKAYIRLSDKKRYLTVRNLKGKLQVRFDTNALDVYSPTNFLVTVGNVFGMANFHHI